MVSHRRREDQIRSPHRASLGWGEERHPQGKEESENRQEVMPNEKGGEKKRDRGGKRRKTYGEKSSIRT